MKHDKLEQFIKDKANDFNSFEPPAMAWETIEKQLPETKHSLVRKLWPYTWKAAAAILIFASAWMLNDYTDRAQNTEYQTSVEGTESNAQLTELSDAEAYYTTQISSKQIELAKYAKQHPEIIEDLKREFSEMDKNRAELEKDLTESNADEKVIEAIILSYRVKIEILDQMLAELHKSREGNTESKSVETNL
jgi:hypothetical protein